MDWSCQQIDVIVTTAGGIEEDFLKCMAPHYMGDFSLDGATLRRKVHARTRTREHVPTGVVAGLRAILG